jgi:hypothetical protein
MAGNQEHIGLPLNGARTRCASTMVVSVNGNMVNSGM